MKVAAAAASVVVVVAAAGVVAAAAPTSREAGRWEEAVMAVVEAVMAAEVALAAMQRVRLRQELRIPMARCTNPDRRRTNRLERSK